jgi:hypothetical protein
MQRFQRQPPVATLPTSSPSRSNAGFRAPTKRLSFHSLKRKRLSTFTIVSVAMIATLTSIVASLFYVSMERGNRARKRPPPPPILRSKQDLAIKREIAWLASFPNSGTTFTLANMEQVTNLSTATLYDKEILSDVIYPLYPHVSAAPFVFSPHLKLPVPYVLTKTHCIGYCDYCHHSTITDDVDEFKFYCMRAAVRRKCLNSRHFYDMKLVKKVVRLVRDPFSNIVARMHLGVQERRQEGIVDTKLLDTFTDTREGLKAWCNYLDHMFQVPSPDNMPGTSTTYATVSNETIETLKKVPCHSEWFRYVHWHNLLTKLLQKSPTMDSHVVYYEDYDHRLQETVQKLADFLEQPIVQESLTFKTGKTYGHLYTEAEKRAVANLLQTIATPDTFAVLARYLEPFLRSSQKVLSHVDDGYIHGNETAKLVLFVSFPQSGAQYVLENIKTATNSSYAVHIGAPLGPNIVKLWPDEEFSPLLSNPTMNVPQRILARTHCIGGAPDHLPVEDIFVFGHNCRSVNYKLKGKKTVGYYAEQLALGAVTLVRNPFDVIRTRMKRRSRQMFNWTEAEWLMKRESHEGLLQYCKYTDAEYIRKDKAELAKVTWFADQKRNYQKFRFTLANRQESFVRIATCPTSWFVSKKSKRRFQYFPEITTYDEFLFDMDTVKAATYNFPLNPKVKRMFQDLPCYSEWLRYVQFHNYATAELKDVAGRVVYFEDFIEKGPEEATAGLLEFLRLSKKAKYLPFDKRRAAHKLIYSKTEARRAAQLVKTLASDRTWELLRYYFEGQDWSAPK